MKQSRSYVSRGFGCLLLLAACALVSCVTPARRRGMTVCPECWGSGFQIQSDEPCFFCEGTGQQHGMVCPMCGGTGLESRPCETCGGDGWVADTDEVLTKLEKERPSKGSRSETLFQDGIALQVIPNPAAGMVQIHFEGDVKARMGRETSSSGGRVYYVELRPAFYLGEKNEWRFPGETLEKVWVSQGGGTADGSCRISVQLAPGAKARMLSGPKEVRLLVEGVQ